MMLSDEMYWGKELRIPSDSEWRGILRKEAKEKAEYREFVDAPTYKGATQVFDRESKPDC